MQFRFGCAVLMLVAGLASVQAEDRPPGGVQMIPEQALDEFADRPAGTYGRAERVTVQDQPFQHAVRVITTTEPANPWGFQLARRTEAPVRSGDVLLARFFVRGLESRDETGEAYFGFVFERAGDDHHKSIDMAMSAGSEWQRIDIPFVVDRDYAPGEAQIGIRFGYRPQVLEIAQLEVINYGDAVTLADLPRTRATYPGREPDAPWRAAAAERIERLRKGDIAVRVIDAQGRPVEGARVNMEMRRHAFGFGSAVVAHRLSDDSPDSRRYQQVVQELFSEVVFENDLKWGAWEGRWGDRLGREPVMRALPWLEERGIRIRGHVLVWPGWRNLPPDVRELADDHDALRARIDTHIRDTAGTLRGRIHDWDVINEPYDNHDLMDVLGNEEMVRWFKLAHEADPQATLYINDYSILSQGGRDHRHQSHYHNTIQFLLDHGAPLHGIGMQGHFGWALTAPPRLLEILDRFAEFGLTIKVTEFDININDEQLQADYTRDFMTTLFSHPAVDGILMWGFWENQHWRPDAALFRQDWSIRPHGEMWIDLVHNQWRTSETGRTGSDGRFAVRGFLGEYEVEVEANGQKQTVPATLTREGTTLEIRLR